MFYIFKFPLVDEVSVIFEILKRAFVEYLSADEFFLEPFVIFEPTFPITDATSMSKEANIGGNNFINLNYFSL